MKKEVDESPAMLVAIPLGLSIAGLILSILTKDFYWVILFIITVLTFRFAFYSALWRIIVSSGIWIGWILLYPHLYLLVLQGRWS